jgi:hypothetical protein
MLPARTWLWACVALTAGALVAAVGLAPPAGARPVQALSWLLFTGSSVHVASTGWLFTLPEVRSYARAHRVRCLWAPAGLVAGASLAAAVTAPAAFQWPLLAYFGWQFLHYQKQNVGMASLAASALGVRPLQPAERWPLLLSGAAAILGLLAQPRLLSLDVQTAASALSPLAAGAFAVAVAAGLAVLGRRPPPDRPPGFCTAYLSSLLFTLPVFACGSPYAAVGGMTIAHGLQYLLLVGMIAGGAGATASDPRTPSRILRVSMLVNVALIGGALLSAASHLHDSGPAGRLVFGCYLGVVMAHFVIDAGLWRMRDPLARSFLSSRLPALVAVPVRTTSDPSSADIKCAP